jgi:large subunit ribosomal protein L35
MMRGYRQVTASIPSRGEIPMPKQKTHKGTKKRFRLTAKGKAKHRSAGTSHLAARMSQKRKRQLRGTETSSDTEAKMVRKALAGNSY